MVKYVKCPRCELNYIDEEKQEYCDVCLAEMHGDKLQFADLDDEEIEELDAELESADICPVCGINPVRFGEKMCESCKQETSEYESEEDIDIENDEIWKNYIDDDTDLTINDEEMAELDVELDGEDDEESEEFYDDDDPISDFDDSLDDDFDEDYDDDDDSDDDDDDF